MDKNRRHRLITRMLRSSPAPSQDFVRDRLHEAGVAATQATISRDLRELGVIKTGAGYTLPETLGAPSGMTAAAGERVLELSISTHLVSAEAAGSLVVLKTEPGHAQALAAELDRAGLKKVVGSIAGDDTIFLAARSVRDAGIVLREVERLGAAV